MHHHLAFLCTVILHYTIMKLVEVYREHKPTIAMFDDAKWEISKLENKYKLGLITDGNLNTQQNKAKAYT